MSTIGAREDTEALAACRQRTDGKHETDCPDISDEPLRILDTPDGIAFYRLAATKSALSLELKGIRIRRGFSAYAFAKRTYDLKGSRESVLRQLEGMVLSFSNK